jgi:hypothetical protein
MTFKDLCLYTKRKTQKDNKDYILKVKSLECFK